MSRKLETVRERIEDVRLRIPPPKGRRAKNAYISKDDFADLIGVSRGRVIAWTRPENPDYPDAKSRARLAAISDGRYTADDFARNGREKGRLERRVEALERTVERLERHISGRGASRAR